MHNLNVVSYNLISKSGSIQSLSKGTDTYINIIVNGRTDEYSVILYNDDLK